METTFWRTWLRCPQSLPVRRVLFRIHAWVGIGVGLYVLLISVSGSILMFYPELYEASIPSPTVAEGASRLDRTVLKRVAERAHPGYEVSWIWERKGPNGPIEIWMADGLTRKQRLFDPYTGEELGDAIPRSVRLLNWVKDLHVNLVSGTTGRMINGIGAVLLVILGATGAVIWWPGVNSWRRHLKVRPRVHLRRLNWEVHSAIGFWTVPFVLMWGVTGMVLVLDTTPVFAPEAKGLTVPSSLAAVCSSLHFGYFAGQPMKIFWAVAGLTPSLLFVTGLLMWWKRSTTRQQRTFR